VSCPGYERALKFVDQVHRHAKASCHGKGASAQERDNVTPPALISTTSSSSSSKWPMVLPSRSSGSRLASTIHSPRMYQVQCLSTWIEDISRSPSSVSDEITIAQMFFFIPARLGTSNALDMAVRCLTVHHLGITQGNEEIVRHGRYAYGKALCNLQKAINDPGEALSSETLCATMILSIYEVDYNSLLLVSNHSAHLTILAFRMYKSRFVDEACGRSQKNYAASGPRKLSKRL